MTWLYRYAGSSQVRPRSPTVGTSAIRAAARMASVASAQRAARCGEPRSRLLHSRVFPDVGGETSLDLDRRRAPASRARRSPRRLVPCPGRILTDGVSASCMLVRPVPVASDPIPRPDSIIRIGPDRQASHRIRSRPPNSLAAAKMGRLGGIRIAVAARGLQPSAGLLNLSYGDFRECLVAATGRLGVLDGPDSSDGFLDGDALMTRHLTTLALAADPGIVSSWRAMPRLATRRSATRVRRRWSVPRAGRLRPARALPRPVKTCLRAQGQEVRRRRPPGRPLPQEEGLRPRAVRDHGRLCLQLHHRRAFRPVHGHAPGFTPALTRLLPSPSRRERMLRS